MFTLTLHIPNNNATCLTEESQKLGRLNEIQGLGAGGKKKKKKKEKREKEKKKKKKEQ